MFFLPVKAGLNVIRQFMIMVFPFELVTVVLAQLRLQ
jgi:hypothetical protein